MKTHLFRAATALLVLTCLAGAAAAQTTTPPAAKDKPVDMKKLLAEIVGDYSFEFQGQTLLVQFTETGRQALRRPARRDARGDQAGRGQAARLRRHPGGERRLL